MTEDITSWLTALGLDGYVGIFVENEIDMSVLGYLTERDLREMGLPIGPRRKVLAAIAARQGGPVADAGATGPRESGRDEPARLPAEYRQLTVVFCDLVESTPLSRRIDPEDLRDIIVQYQDAVGDAVTRYGGHVARYLGDGVLAYFGWPQAFEDQAERAIRAGLQAVKSVAAIRLDDGERLGMRVGIASGRVVVGDLVGQQGSDSEAATGETVNLAARLQTVAEPGRVVVSAATRRLIGGAFELEELVARPLKGFPEPVSAWAVLRESAAESRFEAAHAGVLSHLVGRRSELHQLTRLWARARGGAGQVVLLTGEPGIGKSRLAQALRSAIADEPHARLRHQCSPLHSNSAFYPVARTLERTAGFTGDDSDAEKLDKLETLLRGTAEEVAAAVPLIANLLSIPAADRYGVQELEPQVRRDRTVAALIRQVLTLCRETPVLFVLEDAHWIDPSTSYLLTELIPRVPGAAVLVMITYRPEFACPWGGYRHATTLELGRLDREQSVEMVQAVAGRELPPAVLDRIIARADGVPLHLEELTRSVLESGLPANGTEAADEIPASLHASLTARLDRLGAVKEVAQIGAVIGRSFSPRLLAAVSGRPLDATTSALDRIVSSGLVSCHGTPPEATYSFKHALIQDVAYESLLRRKRRDVHARIADVLLHEFPAQASNDSEQVAHHLSLARLSDRAVEYWLRAGQRAAERSAHVEAIAHLENALREIGRLPPSRAREEREFDARIALGASLLTVEGWSAPRVALNYERARDLGAKGGDVRKQFTALRGLSNVFFLRGEIGKARAMVDRCMVIAREQHDAELLLQSHLATGMCCLLGGDFAAALTCLQRVIDVYQRSRHHALALVSGVDPAVVAMSAVAWAEWFLGRPAAARASSEAALGLAAELQDSFSLAYAHSLAAALHQFRRDGEAVLRHADAAITIAEEHGYSYWQGWDGIMRGWGLAAQGRAQEGMRTLQDGLAIYEGTGARQIRPYALCMQAEMSGWAGAPRSGFDTVGAAYGTGNPGDVAFFEADALRVRGMLAHQLGERDAQAYFIRARDRARRQATPILELRAVVGAIAAGLGDSAEGLDTAAVSALVARLEAAQDEADLREARRVLEDPSGGAADRDQ